MSNRPRPFWALVSMFWLAHAVLPSNGAEFRTTNFVVAARSERVAQLVAQRAEEYRRSKAVDWLGRELPDWRRPCGVEVRIGFGSAGGATSFTFDAAGVRRRQMVLDGPLDRILDSVLPHEVTHTIFADRFGRPMPRWADEGGAVLSEDPSEIRRHDLLVRELINADRMIPLRRLFDLAEYPRDVMALYAQGFSVARYLVSRKGKTAFLDFVHDGQRCGWDEAVRLHYGHSTIEDCQQRWIDWLIAGRGTGADWPGAIANADAEPTPSLTVVRGQIPDDPEPSVDPPPRTAVADPSSPPPVDPFDPGRKSIIAPADRLVPIAVGRTRRTHPFRASDFHPPGP